MLDPEPLSDSALGSMSRAAAAAAAASFATSAAASAASASRRETKHREHERCSSLNTCPEAPRVTRCGEHGPQKTSPQSRQWWRRRMEPKALLQLLQSAASRFFWNSTVAVGLSGQTILSITACSMVGRARGVAAGSGAQSVCHCVGRA